jgi:integrase
MKSALAQCNDKRYLRYIALMAFGGSRRAEAERLSMQDVLFDEKMIPMEPETTKTSTGRSLQAFEECAKVTNL